MSNLTSKITSAVLMDIGGLHNAAARHNTAVICDNLSGLLERFEISTALRLIHFTAQIAHESDSFNALEEYASGSAYEGRRDLGNVHPGDGRRYKGRGPIQCTGRENYRKFTKWVRENVDPNAPDFEEDPALLIEAPWAALSAIWYWSTHDLNSYADRDDLVGGTKKINGGTNGLADRAAKLARAKTVITRLAADEVAYRQPLIEVLHRGAKGASVASLQEALAKLGFHHGAIDGDFGPATEASVISFQKSKGLVADGIAGQRTRTAINDALGLP